MKRSIISILVIILLGCNQDGDKQLNTKSIGYDSLKAVNYGADQYGMKTYVLAFLKKGPNRDFSPSEAAELQRAHLKNITRLAKENKLVLAGPFLGDGDIRGIYIFDVDDLDSARALCTQLPAE